MDGRDTKIETQQAVSPAAALNAKDVLIYANFSFLSYLNSEFLSNVGYRDIVPDGWKYLDSHDVKDSSGDEHSTGSLGGSLSSISKFFNTKYLHCRAFKSDIKKEIIIAFKGTDIKDVGALVADTHIALGKYYPIPDQVKTFVTNTSKGNPGFSIVLVGHSLGGYIATKIAISSDKIKAVKAAYVFDAPGIEAIQAVTHDPKKDVDHVHNFVYQPNIVNCAGHHLGKLYYLQSSEGSDYKGVIDKIVNVVAKDKNGATVSDFLTGMLKNGSKTLISSIISYVTPISKVTAAKVIDGIFVVAGSVQQSIANAQNHDEIKKIELQAKIQHTLKSHRIDAMINGIYAMVDRTDGNNEFKEIDKTSWPTASKFIDSKLEDVVKFTTKTKKFPTTQVIDQKSEYGIGTVGTGNVAVYTRSFFQDAKNTMIANSKEIKLTVLFLAIVYYLNIDLKTALLVGAALVYANHKPMENNHVNAAQQQGRKL